MYDGVLRIRLIGSLDWSLDHWIGDNIALVIRGKHLDELVRMCNTAIGRVRSWIAGIGLKLADHKTDILLINSRKRMEFVIMKVGVIKADNQVPGSGD